MKVDIGTALPKLSKEAQAREEQYQTEDDMRTLNRFHEIHSDGKRVARLHKHIAKQAAVLKALRRGKR